MRIARLTGLSSDGRFVIVTADGEELAIAADDRLRAALRGDRPRLGQLEIEMESALSPREIQTRIRSGESVTDVARVAGVEQDRVERFAAPVLAEREHVAGLAQASSARRRGETSAHRTLRGVLHERLRNRGVDLDTIRWDSFRSDDGRWTVAVDYRSKETPRQAVFYFDRPGRFSVAGNDDARSILGDVSSAPGPQPGRRPPVPGQAPDLDHEDSATEPTLDLTDELALVRVVQDVPVQPEEIGEPDEVPGEVEAREDETGKVAAAEVVPLPRPESGQPPAAADPPEERPESEESGLESLSQMFDDQDPHPSAVTAENGPSDASAVPELIETLPSNGWEPAIVVDYPVEPTEDSSAGGEVEVAEGSDDPGRPEPPVAGADRRDEADALDHGSDSDAVGEPKAAEPEDQPLPLDLPAVSAPPTPPKPIRRKRASVPSWDEIVFGGPKDK